MFNQTTVTEFLLLGFSEGRELQILQFVVFLVIYLVALTGNLFVITAVILDLHLHTLMYFLLINLSILDLSFISVIIPKSMVNCIMNTRSISYFGWFVQVFFFILFSSADVFLLTIMAYDRYIAICKPLHYERVMNRRACVQMAASAWICGLLNSALHTGSTFSITFCGVNMADQFFCEIPQLLKLTCPDSNRSEVRAIVIVIFLGLSCFGLIIVSYVQIFNTVLRIPSEKGQHKALSTCLPHFIVFSLFVSTGTIAYLKLTSSTPAGVDLVAIVLYSLVPPVMNPVIYSMWNKDIKAALWRIIGSRLFSKNKMPIFLP
ncbi:olfactory receptor 14A16-like [Gopherus flavomarginatus]|uniref:olfactory receptor 14A16-like n=1 Tax=Gopherus flavomarginatus TaxID=286002 RepID=UPI0021CB9F0C|nr:olfactory receptor 14A16-like [Gopherus flavomarginatus]